MASDEVEGIHIINKTANRFTISNDQGEFIIPARLNDTILFSGISYHPKEIVISKLLIASKQMTVYLEELVNALDEVVVGKVLSGDLKSDLLNSDLKRKINFYDLGIPGYAGKPKTQSERRVYEATTGDGFIPLNPIINGITGRTKRLKMLVRLEKSDDCLDKMKSDFADDLFSNHDLDEDRKAEYFYYCQDDPQFDHLCNAKNDMETFEFLVAKLETFKAILREQRK